MTTIRKANYSPSYSQINEPEKERLIHAEMKKFKPKVEVTLSGGSEIATGRIVEWFPKRHFFIVEWERKSKTFKELNFEDAALRVYFKAKLFSTLVVFKSTPVRKGDDRFSDYRIPTAMYQQQSRSALRVPLKKGAGTLSTPRAEFDLIDLSVNGARIKHSKPSRRFFKTGTELSPAKLKLGNLKLHDEDFKIVITSSTLDDYGCRFVGMSPENKTLIKHYLIDALRAFYGDVAK